MADAKGFIVNPNDHTQKVLVGSSADICFFEDGSTVKDKASHSYQYDGYAVLGKTNSTTMVNISCPYVPNKLIGLACTTSMSDIRLFNPVVVPMCVLKGCQEICVCDMKESSAFRLIRLYYVNDNTIGLKCDEAIPEQYAVAFTV